MMKYLFTILMEYYLNFIIIEGLFILFIIFNWGQSCSTDEESRALKYQHLLFFQAHSLELIFFPLSTLYSHKKTLDFSSQTTLSLLKIPRSFDSSFKRLRLFSLFKAISPIHDSSLN